MPDLTTRWGRALDVDEVLPEHPRPQLVRDSHLNLNGRWEHAFTAADAPAPSTYDGPIVVPFSPEAPLSGVGRQLQPDERLWYRRTVTLPDGFVRDRVLLHFGAVDQTCTVWLNDVEVGSNDGGYWPFTLDVTDALRPGREHARGRRPRPLRRPRARARASSGSTRGDIWYTAQSGIWQTVWIESVPATYVERLDAHAAPGGRVSSRSPCTPRARPARVHVPGSPWPDARSSVPVGEPARIAASTTCARGRPRTPTCTTSRSPLGDDRVSSYAGMRSVAVATDADGTPRMHLNGEPVPARRACSTRATGPTG